MSDHDSSRGASLEVFGRGAASAHPFALASPESPDSPDGRLSPDGRADLRAGGARRQLRREDSMPERGSSREVLERGPTERCASAIGQRASEVGGAASNEAFGRGLAASLLQTTHLPAMRARTGARSANCSPLRSEQRAGAAPPPVSRGGAEHPRGLLRGVRSVEAVPQVYVPLSRLLADYGGSK